MLDSLCGRRGVKSRLPHRTALQSYREIKAGGWGGGGTPSPQISDSALLLVGTGGERPTARAGREGLKPALFPEPGPQAGPLPPTEEQGSALTEFHVSPARGVWGLFQVWVLFLNQYHPHRTSYRDKKGKSQKEGGRLGTEREENKVVQKRKKKKNDNSHD